jgi:hypothetical protein
MAPLQRLKVKPIEDPAEQAALDERIQRAARTAHFAQPIRPRSNACNG